MRIAICDDLAEDRKHIIRFIETHAIKHEIIEFDSAIPFMKRIHEHFDVLFLDIQMPDSCGWEVANLLKKSKSEIYVVIVTINNNYIYDCFDRVDWFAPKPIYEAKVHQILDNACDKLFPTSFDFIIDKVTVSLTSREIIYIEVKRNDIYIYTLNETYKISAIKELYISGLKTDVEEHINILNNKIYFTPNVVRTPILSLNAILMDELRKAKKEDIDVILDINITKNLKINTFDLCVILGNTIENAINACCLLPDGIYYDIKIKTIFML